MAHPVRRIFGSLDFEERILNAAALIAVIGIFLPWSSGEWLGGETASYSALGFFTSLIGWTILLLLLYTLCCTFVPLFGGPYLVGRRHLQSVRLAVAAQALILTLCVLTVLTDVTFEFSRMNVRFGVYVTLIGAMIATLYSFLKWQEQRRREQQDLFHHPEEKGPLPELNQSRLAPPPPPPPPPLAPEEHNIR